MRSLLILLLSSIFTIAAAQDSVLTFKVAKPKMTAESASSPIIEEKIFQVVEQMPQFPGGENAMMKFIMKNFNTSNLSESDEIVGKFIVGFIVREDGSISDIKVKRSVSPTYDAEALRVLKSFPKFKPGRQNGKAVPVSFILPIYLDFSRN